MATSGNGKRKSSSRSTSTKKKTSGKRGSTAKKQQEEDSFVFKKELIMIGSFIALIFIFLCIIGVITSAKEGGKNLGDYIRMFFTGLFGVSAFYLPIATIGMVIIFRIFERDKTFYIRFAAIILLMVTFGMFSHLFAYPEIADLVGTKGWGKEFYTNGTGGGWFFGAITFFFVNIIGKIGCVFVAVLLTLIGLGVFLVPFIPSLIEYARREREEDDEYEEEYEEEEEPEVKTRSSRRRVVTDRVVDHDLSKLQKKKEEQEQIRTRREREEEESDDGLRLMNSSVPAAKTKEPTRNPEAARNAGGIHIAETNKAESNNIHRVVLPEEDEDNPSEDWIRPVKRVYPEENNKVITAAPVKETKDIEEIAPVPVRTLAKGEIAGQQHIEDVMPVKTEEPTQEVVHLRSRDKADLSKNLDDFKAPTKLAAKYRLPSTTLLKEGNKKGRTDDRKTLEETARRLEETLETFGVRVHVTDYSKGPAVTRYELQPEMGVKVSKIVSLADDIKLNLAAADIRIEAPIPGKQAVGIEVPNAESSAVTLRELLESSEYKDFKSNIAFAVGKDIAGDVVVSDLAKMPHMLIAGATGSGKSVCINTLIMSILFKAHPDDVKLILIDPKVVELSVYNGIPHLLYPVVTDPKQASAALQWGVNEMTERYKKFADQGVRDLKGYNEKAENQPSNTPEEDKLTKLPQLVIIVDELADLMMVAGKEVEESICRLAQLARAAGIHLVIATQRPSVDVITGLIKANMPSRIAFSVSSGVDSRTILDTNGAEKLLGKGDMLFFPQWLNKPSRVQGAFVSDEEVQDVVDFIKNQNICSSYKAEIPTVVSSNISGGSAAPVPGDDRDEYFAEAGRFVIDKQKGSIGMLQRIFKIGFNRAARIMDQLEEAGVVGPEEGTKPRRILMDSVEFEEFLQSEH